MFIDVINHYRYEKLQEKSGKLGDGLSEIHHSLTKFSGEAAELEKWLTDSIEQVTDNLMPNRIEEICSQRDLRKDLFLSTVKEGKALIGKKDVTDTGAVRDRVKVICKDCVSQSIIILHCIWLVLVHSLLVVQHVHYWNIQSYIH